MRSTERLLGLSCCLMFLGSVDLAQAGSVLFVYPAGKRANRVVDNLHPLLEIELAGTEFRRRRAKRRALRPRADCRRAFGSGGVRASCLVQASVHRRTVRVTACDADGTFFDQEMRLGRRRLETLARAAAQALSERCVDYRKPESVDDPNPLAKRDWPAPPTGLSPNHGVAIRHQKSHADDTQTWTVGLGAGLRRVEQRWWLRSQEPLALRTPYTPQWNLSVDKAFEDMELAAELWLSDTRLSTSAGSTRKRIMGMELLATVPVARLWGEFRLAGGLGYRRVSVEKSDGWAPPQSDAITLLAGAQFLASVYGDQANFRLCLLAIPGWERHRTHGTPAVNAISFGVRVTGAVRIEPRLIHWLPAFAQLEIGAEGAQTRSRGSRLQIQTSTYAISPKQQTTGLFAGLSVGSRF